LLQASGIKTAIEAHRRAKPFCMGTLYWQSNDCWPVTSWSSTDYYGEWKALHYKVKKAYQKYLISPVVENGKINVYVVSDSKKETNAFLEMKLIDLNGTVQWSKSFSVAILADSCKIYYSIDSAEVLKNADPAKSVFSVKLIKDNLTLSENLLYFCITKDLKITQPLVTYSFSLKGSGVVLELESKTFVKDVFIDFADTKVKLSDNYFDLLPGEKKTVEIESSLTSGELTKKIKVKSLFDTF
jgi:beta-mannosidase